MGKTLRNKIRLDTARRMKQLPHLFATACLTMLTACATTPTEQSKPRQDAGPLRPILVEDSGATDPAARGVWQSRGYDRLLRIDETGVPQFEIGHTCYRPRISGESLLAT